MFLSMLIKRGKYRFYAMSERTLCYRTDNVWANTLGPKNGKGSVEH
jgi:hypothetical protein